MPVAELSSETAPGLVEVSPLPVEGPRPSPPASGNKRFYRADIDGLRAIAVLLVVAFHLDFQIPLAMTIWVGKYVSNTLSMYLQRWEFTGGYIGVDIFFVISGFLISSILLREQASNTFSVIKFYERRIRRIVPALTAVLLFTFIAGYLSLIPSQMKDLAKCTLAATFSGANIFFWQASGYFDAPALSEPLLHTWSLAVEEQFYLIFPLVLLLLHRFFRRYLKVTVLLLMATSFGASAFGVYRFPQASFYLAHSRAWELLLGTLLALGLLRLPSTTLGRNLASLIGLLAILCSSVVYSSSTRFPGSAALLPCGGAALIIMAGMTGPSMVGRLLSTKPFVFVGLISYSLYLWHWPLLVMNKYEYFRGIHLSKVWLFVVIFLIAAISRRLVETPFRAGPNKLSRRQIFVAAVVAFGLLTALSSWGIFSNGIPSRLTPDELAIAHYTDYGSPEAQWGRGCFASVDLAAIDSGCLAQSRSKPNYLLFGDSHAAHLWFGLSQIFPTINFSEATASQCKPLLSSRSSPASFCRHLVDSMFHQLVEGHPFDVVILSAVWNEGDLRSLAETVAYLHAAKVRIYVVGPIVAYDQPLPTLLVKAIRSGDSTFAARHRLRSEYDYTALDKEVEATVMRAQASRYISLREILCKTTPCTETAAPNVPVQFDAFHLTNRGSLLVAQRMQAAHYLP